MPENQEGIAFSFSLAHTYFREVFSTRSAVYRVEGNISSAPHNHRLAINSMSYTEDALRVIPSFVLTYLIAVLRRSREVVVFLIRLPHILGTVFWSRAQFVVPAAQNRLVLNHVGGHPTPIAPIMHIYALSANIVRLTMVRVTLVGAPPEYTRLSNKRPTRRVFNPTVMLSITR